MTEPRICYHAGSRKIYNEGWCGEFKTYTLPARTIKMYGSTLNLVEGCNRCRAKLLKEIVREHKRKPSFKPCRLPMDGFIKTVRVGSHREWIETRPKHGFHRIVEEYTTKYSDCLPGKAWLKEHEHDIDKYPEATIELSINGKLLSVNGDYKKGAIRDFMKPYITKVRVGRKVATLNIGEADRVNQQAVQAGRAELAKERWQMTQQEVVDSYIKSATSGARAEGLGFTKAEELRRDYTQLAVMHHRLAVQQALSEGQPVPPEVLKDYPELAPKPVEKDVQADKVLPCPVINERSEKKMRQKPNNHKRRQILDFARDNNLVIHPGGGFEYYIKNFYDVGHCPCAKERLECPCPESIDEVKNDGWCKCHLFWRDLDTYKNSHVPEY